MLALRAGILVPDRRPRATRSRSASVPIRSGIAPPWLHSTVIPPAAAVACTRSSAAAGSFPYASSDSAGSGSTGRPRSPASGATVCTHRARSTEPIAVGPNQRSACRSPSAWSRPFASSGRCASSPFHRDRLPALACRTSSTMAVGTGWAANAATSFRSRSTSSTPAASSGVTQRSESTSSLATKVPSAGVIAQ